MSAKLLLDYAYENESKHTNKIWLSQPLPGDVIKDYTWGQAMDEARRIAQYLKEQNFEPGSKIAMVSKNCASFMIVDLAVWMAGHVTVAIYPTVNEETASYILEHSDSRLLFVGKLDAPNWEEIRPGIPADMPCIAMPQAPKSSYTKWADILSNNEPIAGQPARQPDELAIIIYTSGSTGRPKGVMHSFGAMSKATEGIVEALKITGSDRGISYLPLAHVFERAYVECSSIVGKTHIYFVRSIDSFVKDLKRAEPTLFISVPRLWLKFQLGVFQKFKGKKVLDIALSIPLLRRLIRKKVLAGLGLNNVRLAGSGSAPIPAELIALYRQLGLNLLEGYAMSEDFAYSHLSTEEYSEPGYVGVPYKGVDVRISEEGEILINSIGKMMGYYKQEELTAKSFTEDGFFKTGDRGERKPNGLLKITGRVKELFKTSKGKYISPAPIENIINNDPNIELSCVSGLGYPQPYAQVNLAEALRPQAGARKEELTRSLESLLSKVNQKVEHHERLQFIVVISEAWTTENSCLTPTMKIRRSAIEEKVSAQLDGWYDAKQKVIWA